MNLSEISEAATAAKNLDKLFKNLDKIGRVADTVVANRAAISDLEKTRAGLQAEAAELR